MSLATRTDTESPALQVADSHDLIRVHGARVNNLKDVGVEIPKRRLTVFTGVSGSGKSSLVFGTIAAESQRMINETYSAFVQGFMPTQSRPEVDLLEGLTTAIIVDQERIGSNSRSTVGTVTDANAMLRIVYSRLGQPHIGSPKAYSFNVPSVRASGAITVERGSRKTVKKTFSVTGGMCSRREGMGSVTDLDLARLFDDSKSLSEGAITVPGYQAGGWNFRLYSASGFVDPDKPIRKYTKTELHDFLHREPTRMKINNINMTYEGLIPRIQKSMLSKDKEAMQPHIRAFVDRAVTFTTCPDCDGTRLNEGARSSKIKAINIADACAMQITDLAEWVRAVDEPSVAPLLATLQQTVDSFVEIGLGYLSLDRPSGTLSGGEAQRVKMIRHLESSLTDVTYVFDEPTIGLHPHDIQRMNDLLLALRDKGNTVLVVEHKPWGGGAGGAPRGGRGARARRRYGGRHRLLCGHRRGAAGQRHPHRPPSRRPGRPSRRRCGRPPARWRSAARRRTTCATSTSTSRSGCSSSSPASPAPARARSCTGRSRAGTGTVWCRSTRARSAARDGATRRPTPDCSIRSARRSRRPTASSRRCSAPTPRAPAPTATAPASSTPTWR